MNSTRRILAAYLKATGWSQAEFARRTGVDPSFVARLLSDDDDRRDVGIEGALRIERGTRAAKESGATKVRPLLARDLLAPDLAALLPNTAA